MTGEVNPQYGHLATLQSAGVKIRTFHLNFWPPCSSLLYRQPLSAGKQRKLTSWLGAVTTDSSSQPTAPARPDFCSQQPSALSSQAGIHHAPTDTTSQPPTRANSLTTAASSDNAAVSGRHLPSSFTRRGSGARAGSGKHGVKAGQTSLRAFMQSPAAAVPAMASAAAALQAGVQNTHSEPSTPACAGLLGLAPTGSSDPQGHQTAARQCNVGTVSDPSGAQDSTQLPMQDPSQLSCSNALSQTQSVDAQPGMVLQPASNMGLKCTHLLINQCKLPPGVGGQM